ncbi:MAG: XRE family transcriptional regulator [Eubacterium sp.]|jgi:phage repressor protein C with HTH and peptisase S24 domain|nr:XRE family transcriptional regulator [Eubacterium sp.]
MTIGKRIKQRRKELGLSADQVAERLGVDRTTLFRYERGAITKVPTSTMAKLAKILYTSPVYLMGLSDAPSMLLTPATLRISRAYEMAPQREQGLVKNILADYLDNDVIYVDFKRYSKFASTGNFLYGDNHADTVSVRLDKLPDGYELDPDRYFGVLVSGDSLEPLYQEGDVLIVKDSIPDLGDIVVAVVKGEGYVKKIGSGTLMSLNPDYDDLSLSESDVSIHFCGKIVGTLDPYAFK